MEEHESGDATLVRRLESYLAALRARYQTNHFDLTHAIEEFRLLQEGAASMPEDAAFLLEEARTVDADLSSIPGELLRFAQAHGAGLHWYLLDGTLSGVTGCLATLRPVGEKDKADDLLRYTYENIGRLLRSAVALINFNIGVLSTGYLRSGTVDERRLRAANYLLVMARVDNLTIDVYGNAAGVLRMVGHYVARKIALRRPTLLCEGGTISLLAEGGYAIYRWSLEHPTPAAEFASPRKNSIGFRLCPRAGRQSEIVAYDRDGCWRLDPVSLAVITTIDDSVPYRAGAVALWWDEDSQQYRGVFKDLATTALISSRQLGETGGITVDLGAMLRETYPVLFAEYEIRQVIEVQLEEIQGARCLAVTVQLLDRREHRYFDAIAFLDPYRLQPIRSCVLVPQEIAWSCVIRDRQNSFLVATLRPDPDREAALAVWDISNFIDAVAPSPLHFWPQGSVNLRNLCLTTAENGTWDAYFLSEAIGVHAGPSEIRRLNLANGNSERVLSFHAADIHQMAGLPQVPQGVIECPPSFVIAAEGKTDYIHMEAALRAFHERGAYEQLRLDLSNSMNFPEGDANLLKNCIELLARAPLARRIVFVFDRDNPAIIPQVTSPGSNIKRWSDHVYSLAIPIPRGRVGADRACIEMYYPDEDLKKAAADGRRMFLRSEFDHNGFHSSGRFVDPQPRSLALVADKVLDTATKTSAALSKAAFAEAIGYRTPPFDQMNFDAFGDIFDLFADILQQDLG